MEFKLDWERGTDRIVSVFYRPGTNELAAPDGHHAGGMPELPLYANGRQYLANCYNSNPTHGSSIAMLWLLENGKARPVTALGRAHDWSNVLFFPPKMVQGTVSHGVLLAVWDL